MHFLGLWALGIGLGVLSATLLLHATHLHGQGHPRPHFQIIRWLHAHLLVAAACAVLAGFLAGALAVTGYAVLYGPHGVVQPPVPAQSPHGAKGHGGKHGLGFLPSRLHFKRPRTYGGVLPASVDLSQFAPNPGDQGSNNACASWAVGYTLRSWYARRDGLTVPGGFAPMYLYSQITQGQNIGTGFPDNYNIVASQGIDTQADYWQGNYNYGALPTNTERANAAQYRSLGFQPLFVGQNQGYYAQQAIEQAIANGNPVTLGIPVYSNFYSANRNSYYIGGAVGSYFGGHAVVGFKYDSNGLWVLNSWSTSWGLNGWGEISWAFINQFALEADQMIMPHIVAPAPPAPRPHPTPTPPHRAPLHHAGYWLLVRAQQVRPRPALWPSTHRLLRPGIRLHATGRVRGRWRQFYVPGGIGWLLTVNVRSAY